MKSGDRRVVKQKPEEHHNWQEKGVVSSTTADMELFERKENMSKRGEEENKNEERFENSDTSHT